MDILSMQSIVMEVEADINEIAKEIVEEWQEPLLKQQLATFWAMMPAEEKDGFKREHPAEYEALTQFIKGA